VIVDNDGIGRARMGAAKLDLAVRNGSVGATRHEPGEQDHIGLVARIHLPS